MQRKKLVITLILCGLAIAGGCSRQRERKQPLSVDRESDFIYIRKADIIGGDLEVRKDTSKMTDAERKAEELAKKIKDEADKIKRREDTAAMGAYLRNYRAANPAKLYAYEKVSMAMRRQGKLDMYDDLTLRRIDVPFLMDLANPAHIVCYHKTVEDKLGHPAFFASGTAGYVDAKQIDQRLKEQEINVAWHYCVQYAMLHYYRSSAEFPPYLPSPLTPQPTPFLERVRARSPELVKNPPDQRTPDRFKKFLEDNAPPELLQLIESGKLVAGMNADMWNAQDVAICRGTPEQKDPSGNEKSFMAVSVGGALFYSPQLKNWVDQNRPKTMK